MHCSMEYHHLLSGHDEQFICNIPMDFAGGVVEMVWQSVMMADADIQDELLHLGR